MPENQKQDLRTQEKIWLRVGTLDRPGESHAHGQPLQVPDPRRTGKFFPVEPFQLGQKDLKLSSVRRLLPPMGTDKPGGGIEGGQYGCLELLTGAEIAALQASPKGQPAVKAPEVSPE